MTAELLSRNLEALLFVAAEPLEPASLARLFDLPTEDVVGALDLLAASYQGRGLRLVEHRGRYELVTHPDTKAAVNTYLGAQTKTDLSKPTLETLAIIAWKQPIAKATIEQLRGVSSDQTLKNLLMRGLIAEAERLAEPGQPVGYRTTAKFLHLFGLTSPSELPAIEEIASPPDASEAS